MTPKQLKKLDKKLGEFLHYITDGMGRPERRNAMSKYLTGLLLDGERKTAVSMASRLVDDESEAEAMRQRLQQCVTQSTWADEEIRKRLALRFEKVLKPEAFVLDDTGFAKKGKHSVGVARQYSGTLGRVDNCQVATSLHLAANEGSGCIGMQLYLPEEWIDDTERCKKVGVPRDLGFQTKWQIGLKLLDEALEAGLAPRVMLADSGYGDCPDFRDGLVARECAFVVGITGTHLTWPPGSNPRPPKTRAAMGRPRTRARDGKKEPLQLSKLIGTMSFRTYSVANGQGGKKKGRFAFERVHLAEGHKKGRAPSDECWLITEHRPGNNEYRHYVSNLSAETTKRELVRMIKLRWRIERDYQEMKGQIGLDHFEGRTWRGFHHHATLCAVAHGFLAIQRRLFPPDLRTVDASHGATSPPIRAARQTG